MHTYGDAMLLRRETPSDIPDVRRLMTEAFAVDPRTRKPMEGEPVEVRLLDQLRASDAWMPPLSWVAVDGEEVLGYAVCTRAHVDGTAVVGLGPIGVQPKRQRSGVGSALIHALLGASDALDVPLVGLLGDPAYYDRFGFCPSADLAIVPPNPAWGDDFQVRALSAHSVGLAGTFAYSRAFDDLG